MLLNQVRRLALVIGWHARPGAKRSLPSADLGSIDPQSIGVAMSEFCVALSRDVLLLVMDMLDLLPFSTSTLAVLFP